MPVDPSSTWRPPGAAGTSSARADRRLVADVRGVGRVVRRRHPASGAHHACRGIWPLRIGRGAVQPVLVGGTHGLDQLLLRARLAIGWRLATLVTGLGAATGALVAGGAVWSGGLAVADAALAGLSVTAGGLSVTVAGALRAAGRARDAVPYTTGANWMIFAIGVTSLVSPFATATTPLALFLAGNLLRAIFGWRLLLRTERLRNEAVAIEWREALSLAGIAAVGTAMLQMERLLIPPRWTWPTWRCSPWCRPPSCSPSAC